MLHKDLKINRTRQYSFIYKKGKRLVGKYLIIFIIRNRDQESRFGIVTSKKVGNAVVRNKAKRQIREVIRKNLDCMPKGYDVVIVAKYNVKQATLELIQTDLKRLIRKATGK